MVRNKNDMLALGVIFVLVGATVADTEETNSSVRNKRQVTYMKSLNESKEDEIESHHDFHHPVTKRPLPFQLAYPGDLSRFFTSGNTGTSEPHSETNIDNTTETKNSSADEDILRREKRGGYILEKKETVHSSEELRSQSEPLISAASIRSGFVQQGDSSKVIPSEISFDGAGFLRENEEPGLELISYQPESSKTRPVQSGSNRKSYVSLSGNSQAIYDFKAAFNPSVPRQSNTVRYDDDEEQNYENRQRIKVRPGEEINPKSNDVVRLIDSLRNHNTVRNHPTGVVPKRRKTVRVMRQNAPVRANPFSLNGRRHFSDHSSAYIPYQTEETFSNSHSLHPFQAEPKFPFSRHFFPYSNHMFARKVIRAKRSTLTHQTSNPVKVSEHSDFEATSQESRKKYHVESRKDQHRADSGFIPITGSYDGGVIHLSLPYYGNPSPQPPNYGSPNPVHVFHSYSSPPPSPGPQSRHYRGSGSVDHFFHPSEARRFSYGVLGSGNFEVIRGGIFPDNDHGGGNYHGESGHGYHSSRTPYGNNNYNNYGTTEIIIDGPIRGFQGFDNFPTHLINALSKHAEVTVHVPPERRQDESQLIPVSYPLQAVS